MFIYLDTLFHGLVEQHNVELEGVNILICLHVRRMVYVGFMRTVSNSKKNLDHKKRAALGWCVMMLMCLEQICTCGIWGPEM